MKMDGDFVPFPKKEPEVQEMVRESKADDDKPDIEAVSAPDVVAEMER